MSCSSCYLLWYCVNGQLAATHRFSFLETWTGWTSCVQWVICRQSTFPLENKEWFPDQCNIDWSVVDLYICHSSCEWYIWNPCNFQNSGYQQSKDFKGYKIAQNSSTVTLPKRLLWYGCDESDAATWIVGDNEVLKLSSVAASESLKAKTISDLWTSNPVQSGVVECKEGGADVALWLLMWRPPNCWALPHGSYCQPRGSGRLDWCFWTLLM